MASAQRPRYPVLLIVIDGWGIAPPGPANAISQAQLKSLPRLQRDYPQTELDASGEAVGLPAGQMGNSEVGHLTIGAGRTVDQDFVRITKAVRGNQLAPNPVLRDLFAHCRGHGTALHLIGLLGPGGVHSHEEHLFGLVEAARDARVPRTWIHHALDGRDTPPKSALEFARRAEDRLGKIGHGHVATVQGRFWIMDRDKRWERTERAYRCLTELRGHRVRAASDAIEDAYRRGETDEFVAPTVVGNPDPVRSGDAVLVYNFRPDRVRQISRALGDPSFREFPREALRLKLASLTLLDQSFEAFHMAIAFPPFHPKATLGELYSRLGLRQLRIAETEKYAHVTYFFSGGREAPFPGEDRLLVPSPKVATYDLQPEMSAPSMTDQLLGRLESTTYDLVVLNFANPDMVGHSGRLEPTRRACEVVDACIGRIVDAGLSRGYLVVITADHGNAEQMTDPGGGPFTAHTSNRVPLVFVHPELRGLPLDRRGGLSSVAPTLLRLVGLEPPREMTAPSLLGEDAAGSRPGRGDRIKSTTG